jgi:hypothetical protein
MESYRTRWGTAKYCLTGVVMWLENIPSISHFEQGRVMVMWEEETSPPSRASSKGGGDDVVGKHPLCLCKGPKGQTNSPQ